MQICDARPPPQGNEREIYAIITLRVPDVDALNARDGLFYRQTGVQNAGHFPPAASTLGKDSVHCPLHPKRKGLLLLLSTLSKPQGSRRADFRRSFPPTSSRLPGNDPSKVPGNKKSQRTEILLKRKQVIDALQWAFLRSGHWTDVAQF